MSKNFGGRGRLLRAMACRKFLTCIACVESGKGKKEGDWRDKLGLTCFSLPPPPPPPSLFVPGTQATNFILLSQFAVYNRCQKNAPAFIVQSHKMLTDVQRNILPAIHFKLTMSSDTRKCWGGGGGGHSFALFLPVHWLRSVPTSDFVTK